MVELEDRRARRLWSVSYRVLMARLGLVAGLIAFSARAALAGPLAYVPSQDGGTVSVVDIGTHAIVASPTVGYNPVGAAVSPDATRVYVATYGGVTVLDADTFQIVGTIPTGNFATGVAATPGGARLYVTNQGSNTVSVIDALSSLVVATIPMPTEPLGIAMAPDGAVAYVVDVFGISGTQGALSVVSTATNTIVGQVPLGDAPLGVAVSPDGSRVYVANYWGSDPTHASPGTVSVVDAGTNTIIDTITVGSGPSGVALSPTGDRLYVANECGTVLPCNSGRYSPSTVSIIDLASRVVLDTISVGHGAEGMALTRDGDEVVVVNYCGSDPTCTSNGTISVLDTASHAVVATVAVGTEASAVGSFLAHTQCGREPPTFESIDCELNTLIEPISVSSAVEDVRDILLVSLNRAATLAREAAIASDPRRERSFVKEATRRMRSFKRRVLSLTARARIDPSVGTDFEAKSTRLIDHLHALLE